MRQKRTTALRPQTKPEIVAAGGVKSGTESVKGASLKASQRTAAKQFIEVLQDTLSIELTIKELKLTRDDARELLREMGTRLFGSLSNDRKQEYEVSADFLDSVAVVESLVVHVDGASRGNPGLAGAGAMVKDSQGRVVRKLRRYLGEVTNNVAEYEALLMALEEAATLGCKRLKVFADSELVVKQVKGLYRVKNKALKDLYVKAMKIISGFDDFKIDHVMREDNAEADKLANEAIDGVK